MCKGFHHSEHTVDSFGINDDFALSLCNVEFRSTEHAAGNIFELEVFVFLVFRFDDKIGDFHKVFCKPYHNGDVHQVEGCVID